MTRLLVLGTCFAVLLACLLLDHEAASGQCTTVSGTIGLGKVTVSSITSTTVLIEWETMTDSTSQVFYDAVSHANAGEYANRSHLDATRTMSHTVALSGLAPSHAYHFRVESVSGAITTISEDISFTTLPSGVNAGGGGPALPAAGGPGITNLAPYINSSGMFNMSATAASDDASVRLDVHKGVRGLTADGRALKSLCIAAAIDAPAPEPDTSLVGPTYRLSPEGATFSPPVTLTFSYDPTLIPDGAAEDKLVLVTREVASDKWEELKSDVDMSAHTVAGSIDHLGLYAVCAHTAPASFTLSDLDVFPERVDPGETVSASAKVSNSGDLSGSYMVELRVNGTSVAERDVAVGGHAIQPVTLTTVQTNPGEYAVEVNGLTGRFTVDPVDVLPVSTARFKASNLNITPVEIVCGQNIYISFTMSNTGGQAGTYVVTLLVDHGVVASRQLALEGGASETVCFSASEVAPGEHLVEVEGLAMSFRVQPASVTVRSSFSRWLVLGGGFAVTTAIAAVPVFMLTRRRNRTQSD